MICNKDIHYFDNNGTTPMDFRAISAMLTYINRGNPSADYAAATTSKHMIGQFSAYLLKICNESSAHYQIFYTSGASESNCTIIRGVVLSWIKNKNTIPHLIIGITEHKSILLLCEQLADLGQCTFDLVPAEITGEITGENVQMCIQRNNNVALVCVMGANNELGTINNLPAIYAVCAAASIPLFSDMVQSFGKFPPNLRKYPIAAISVSFHKYGGAPGVGALIILRNFLTGYKLCPLICGTQNEGFRGGTENIPGISSAFAAMKIYWESREKKNRLLASMREVFLTEINHQYQVVNYSDYLLSARYEKTDKPYFVLMGGSTASTILPNTILISYLSPGRQSCNAKIKKKLCLLGYIVSIGSACNTKSKYASHVLAAIGADTRVRAGTIRISFGDQNSIDEVKTFAGIFVNVCATA